MWQHILKDIQRYFLNHFLFLSLQAMKILPLKHNFLYLLSCINFFYGFVFFLCLSRCHQGSKAHICICSAIPKPLLHFLFSHCSLLPCLETVPQSAIWVLLSTWDDLSAILISFRHREHGENILIGGKKGEGHKKASRSFGKDLEVKLVRQKYKYIWGKKKKHI